MKKIITLAAVAIFATGCVYTKIDDGQFSATRVALGNNTAIGHLEAAHGTNSIVLEQYSNNQTEALAAIVSAVAAGLAKGTKQAPAQ